MTLSHAELLGIILNDLVNHDPFSHPCCACKKQLNTFNNASAFRREVHCDAFPFSVMEHICIDCLSAIDGISVKEPDQ
jgi:hypothetical protein